MISRPETNDPFARVSHAAREAIDASRDTQASVRETRRRVRLQGLIMSWQRRPAADASVQAERLAMVLDVVRDEAEAPMGNIQLVEDGTLRIRSASGLSETFLTHFAEVRAGKCCCGTAFRTGAPVVVNEVRTSPLFGNEDRDMLLATGIQSVQSLALSQGARKLGVISLHYREAHIPSRRQLSFQNLASDIAEAVSLALASD